VLDFYTMRLNH